MSYGSPGGVAALVRKFANESGRFDNTTRPMLDDVTAWLAQISSMLDVALSGYALATPVTNEAIRPLLDAYANAQVAAVARGVNGQGRFGDKPQSGDEMLLSAGTDAAGWVKAWVGSFASILNVTPDEVEPAAAPVVWKVVNISGAPRAGM
jgi:hypothetical protein